MRSRRQFFQVTWCLAIIAHGAPAATSFAADWSFDVTYAEDVRAEPFTGRVLILLTKGRGEPRHGPAWFNTEPFLALDVTDWKPGERRTVAAGQEGVLTYPRDFSGVDLSGYRVQAVARFNPFERTIGDGPGNGYSDIAALQGDGGSVDLTIRHIVAERPFVESAWCKLLTVPSPRLSEFYDRPVSLRGSVVLPASYRDQPERRYPVIYTIPGFGGTHYQYREQPIAENNPGGIEFIRVLLDPSCPLGHHVFADSANNGPVGTALVQEFIPALEEQYRCDARPEARFVTGHSSGGWSSLWLQVAHPDDFGGVWSTAPDPVDFHDFQRIDLYQPGTNMHRDENGARRPLARGGGRVLVWYDDFDWMEHVAGPGGQLHSFEAVFSPRGDDGRPKLVWDRRTGEIDTAVAKTWEAYDIRLILERGAETLLPKLKGKLHVFMGSEDTFYLDGATRRLKESLAQLGSDAVVEIHEGKDHSTLMTRELRDRIRREMAEVYLDAAGGK